MTSAAREIRQLTLQYALHNPRYIQQLMQTLAAFNPRVLGLSVRHCVRTGWYVRACIRSASSWKHRPTTENV